MILTLVGLILSFSGSALLVYDTLKSLGKRKPHYLPIIEKDGRKTRKLEPEEGGYRAVKYTSEEIKLTIFLSLLTMGFFLQILDFIF